MCKLEQSRAPAMNEANREQADKCLEVAKTALRAGEVAKAERFALKAAKLFPNDEVRRLSRFGGSFIDRQATDLCWCSAEFIAGWATAKRK